MSNNSAIPKKKRGRPFADKQIDKIRLLEIAVEEFANHGFAGTKQQIIAQKAGITNSLMNYHFEDKEDLWKQAVTQLGGKLTQRFIEVGTYFKDLEGISALKAYARQFIYFSAEHPAFYKIVFHEMCTQTERADWMVSNVLTPFHLLFTVASPSAEIPPSTFGGYPIANISSLLIGAANVFFIHAFQMEKMYGVNPFEKEEIEKHADIVIELLFAKF